MLNFRPELIKTDVTAVTWQEVAQEAGQLLVDQNLIEPAFIDSMIETVHKFGPYMILVPEVCFFHGEPGGMVYEPCISLVTLTQTVHFTEFDNQPIKCAFAFGATDSDSHLQMIQQIAKLLADQTFINLITTNANKDEILARMERVE